MRFSRLILMVATGLVFQAPWIAAQPQKSHPDTIVEYDGQQFMPYAPGITENTLSIAPGLARRSPSQVAHLKQKLVECAALFSQDTLLQAPAGLKITFRGAILPLTGTSPASKAIAAEFETALFTTLAKDSAPAWEPSPDARVTIWFNDPVKLAGTPVINDIYAEPRVTGDFFGHPEMDRISVPYRVVAVKNNPLPYFTPVTREDFILTLITFFQNSIEKTEIKGTHNSPRTATQVSPPVKNPERENFFYELEKIRKMDPELADKLMQAYLEAGIGVAGNHQEETASQVDQNIVLNSWREAVRKLKAEMNAMSPPERKSQAWWSSTEESNVSGLVPAGESGSRPLVRINKNLIDPTKTPNSVQLLVVEWTMVPGTEFSETTGYNLAFGLLAQLSRNGALWNEIFKMIDP